MFFILDSEFGDMFLGWWLDVGTDLTNNWEHQARPPWAMPTLIAGPPPASCPIHPHKALSDWSLTFKMHNRTSVPWIYWLLYLECSLLFSGRLVLFCSLPSENYPGSATVVAGPGVGAVSVQPDVDASSVCVSSGLSFSHGPLTVSLTQHSQSWWHFT